MKEITLIALCLLNSQTDWVSRIDSCARTYDLVCATQCADEMKAAHVQGVPLALALLLVAELQRISFEKLPEEQSAERRKLGRAIDEAAQAGIAALEDVAGDSETWRMRADLLGTMIRTDYQAARYRKKMMEAIDAALQADPKNPAAYVSAAKPRLFARAGQGQDLEQALHFLEVAIALAPELESARALHALALEKMRKAEAASLEWKAIMEKNPDCTPAREALERLEVLVTGSPSLPERDDLPR